MKIGHIRGVAFQKDDCKGVLLYDIFGSFGLSTKEPYTIMNYLSSLSLALASSSVHTSPWHRVRHRNFIFGIHIHIYPPYMHIKCLVILACSFKMAAILVVFFNLLSCPYSHRDFILHTLMYLFFTFIHKMNNATVSYFLKFMSIFLKFFTSHSCALTHGSLRHSL